MDDIVCCQYRELGPVLFGPYDYGVYEGYLAGEIHTDSMKWKFHELTIGGEGFYGNVSFK